MYKDNSYRFRIFDHSNGSVNGKRISATIERDLKEKGLKKSRWRQKFSVAVVIGDAHEAEQTVLQFARESQLVFLVSTLSHLDFNGLPSNVIMDTPERSAWVADQVEYALTGGGRFVNTKKRKKG